jgi:predicted nucleotidyltransferase
MNTTFTSITPVLQEIKRSLHELYGDRLVKLILFGSYARNQANSESDIDLLIILKKPVSQVQEIYNMSDLRVKILLEYDQLVSIIPIAQQDFQTRDIAYLRNIRREGIEL